MQVIKILLGWSEDEVSGGEGWNGSRHERNKKLGRKV